MPKVLHDFQKQLAQNIILPLDLEDFHIQSEDFQPDMVKQIKTIDDSFDAIYQLGTYNQQYWFRLVNSMQEQFPLTRHLYGLENFNRIVISFLSKHPSTEPDLNALGKGFAKWIQAQGDNPETQMLCQSAEFEEAYNHAFTAFSETPMDIQALTHAITNLADRSFHFQTHVHALHQDHLFLHCFLQAKNDSDDELDIKVEKKENSLFLFQSDGEVKFLEAHPTEIYLFKSLKAGMLLEEATERALAHAPHPNPPTMIEDFMQKMTGHGWLIGLDEKAS